jgi:RHS repeat-associated protein
MVNGGLTYYYHINGHGDVTKLTDASGIIVAEYQYDAWGNIISQSGTMASSNRYRYAGYQYDEATGLYYLMARYFNAGIGRFITRDNFHGFEDNPLSLNQYTYTENNPAGYIDPSGYYRTNFSTGPRGGGYGFFGPGLSASKWSSIRWSNGGSRGIQGKGKQEKGTPGNNQAQNKQFNDIVKKHKLTKDQSRKLHDEISGQNYGYHQIDEIAKEIKAGRW